MQWTRQNGMDFLQFPSLTRLPMVFHGIFLRYAENSQGHRISLNTGLGCGDTDRQIWHNRLRIRASFGNGPMVFARQVHGTEVAVCRAKRAGIRDKALRVYLNGDALTTDRPDHALFIQVADCQAVLIVDPVRHAVANVHSGWRGSIQNIIGATVDRMKAAFGSQAKDLICGIGPSLGPCCAEFKNYRQEIPTRFWPYRGPNDHFDFWRISMDQLEAAGVPLRNINLGSICTRCNQHLFFSYRGERQTGRFAAVIGLRSDVTHHNKASVL
jgi:purine-nucleoside/S-methyl-5'-thioadenosine phosphorylase / adenosine deaminase